MTSSRNLMLRKWDIDSVAMLKSWKGHETHVSSMEFDSSGAYLATGGILTAKVEHILDFLNPLVTHYPTFRYGMQEKVFALTTFVAMMASWGQ